MNNDVLSGFINKKKAESPFITLADGESVVIKTLKQIKSVTKSGFNGEEKDVLRLFCDVDTTEGVKEKTFDNGTQRFALELSEKGVVVGCGFTLTRVGLQAKTRYTVSNLTGLKPASLDLPKTE